MLDLTYSTNAANNVAITSPGNVTIPDMSGMEINRVVLLKSQALRALQYTANR